MFKRLGHLDAKMLQLRHGWGVKLFKVGRNVCKVQAWCFDVEI